MAPHQQAAAELPTPDNATAAGLLPGLAPACLLKVGQGKRRPGNVAMLYLGDVLIRSAARLEPYGVQAAPIGAVSGLMPLARQRDSLLDDYLRSRQLDGTPQRLLCSGGLELIYAALAEARGEYPRRRDAADILAQALASRCLPSIETLERYCAMVGWAAADAAVSAGAWGGVYLAGPIAQRLPSFLEQSGFRRMFDQRHQAFADLRAVPTYVVRASAPDQPRLVVKKRIISRLASGPLPSV